MIAGITTSNFKILFNFSRRNYVQKSIQRCKRTFYYYPRSEKLPPNINIGCDFSCGSKINHLNETWSLNGWVYVCVLVCMHVWMDEFIISICYGWVCTSCLCLCLCLYVCMDEFIISICYGCICTLCLCMYACVL